MFTFVFARILLSLLIHTKPIYSHQMVIEFADELKISLVSL